jgi:hypothetical protein
MQVETTKADIHSTTILQTQTDFQQITLEGAFNTASIACRLTIHSQYRLSPYNTQPVSPVALQYTASIACRLTIHEEYDGDVASR